jgi:predicted N-acetyltransferase YhbS
MAKAHGNYYDSLRKVQTHAGYPNHRPEFTRLAYWEGELAGTLRITSDTIRLGEARLHMGGLGWVSTAETHRHKGIARELLADTMNFLRARSYPRRHALRHPQFLSPLRLCHRLGQYDEVRQHR